MTVYCDRLTFGAAVRIVAARLSRRGVTEIALLDGPNRSLSGRTGAALLRACGLRVAEVPFFAGHLASPSGESVYLVARKAAFDLADRASQRLVERSALLGGINRRWGRETVRLWIARQQWLPVERMMVRVLTAEALAGPGATPVLFLAWSAAVPRDLIEHFPSSVQVRVARIDRPGWKQGRISAILWAVRQAVRAFTRARPTPTPDTRPSLLVPQEDALSRDRSYRVQPHWLDDEPPRFRTIVLRLGQTFDNGLTDEDRARADIEVVDLADVAATGTRTPLGSEFRRQFRRLALRGLLAPVSADARAASEAARLLMTSAELADFCVARGVRAFLTCENYLMHADAMQLAAPLLGIRTLAYQYSNMPNASLPMQSTADQFVTFAPMFAERFTWPGFHTPTFHPAGYCYDSSFARVEARALERRARLVAAGARFVIGFFDESVQRDKYGLIDPGQHAAELLALLDLVARDSTVALVFKTQFHHNLRQAPGALSAALERALATGRVELPAHGRHRNIVLPAEVAKSCDITIGHAFGGTASLEAALAGCRSVLVNGCGLEATADSLYARADLMCDSVVDACGAIEAFRRGDRPALGDWGPILHEFDPFRDGQSDRRLRAMLEEAVCR